MKTKKKRIKINNLSDFKHALENEGYKINEFDEEKLKEEISKNFEVDKSVIDSLYTRIKEGEITYRVWDIKDLIDYVEKITLFENEHNKLYEEISKVRILVIDRIEYEREPSSQENVKDMISIIEKLANDISGIIDEEDKIKLEKLEKELDKDYIYTKDIELLKKMIITRKEGLREVYNTETKIKTILIEMPKKIDCEYIKVKKGTVEYHEYITKNIPRLQRLIKNINKYMTSDEKEKTIFNINQSKALQDSINIAIAVYNNKEFKAISGSNEIKGYCKALPLESTVFNSNKVNKLGKLGVGYNRVNDSEKKIFEEIHKQIEEKALKDKGNLILYSKWEPCPSCYFVIHQFLKKHPNIKVEVKYIKKYGE